MVPQPEKRLPIALVEVREIVPGVRITLDRDRDPALAREPDKRLALRIKIPIIPAPVIDVDREFTRAKVRGEKEIRRIVTDHVANDAVP